MQSKVSCIFALSGQRCTFITGAQNGGASIRIGAGTKETGVGAPLAITANNLTFGAALWRASALVSGRAGLSDRVAAFKRVRPSLALGCS